MIKFFEVFPDVTYIYEGAMTTELYTIFMQRLGKVIQSKQIPIEDLCRIFNIMVRISAYSGFNN